MSALRVRVPASSANLGPGFDALGMALSLHLEMGIDDGSALPEFAKVIDDSHPSLAAFRHAGGTGNVWVRSVIPMGRGLGFSGAARVAGVVLGHAQSNGKESLIRDRKELLRLSTELEGHPDNVAASLVGGVTASTGGEVVKLPLGFDPAFIAWVPDTQTSTEKSRTAIASSIPLPDVVFNIGHTALLMAAFAAGDVAVLREATKDRMHQDIRFAASPNSHEAFTAALATDAWCTWLSGSGPTVGVLCAKADAARIAAQLPNSGLTHILDIDHDGAVFI
ncbi:MAG: homoserine kinase [Actinomycetota bacterium]|jgi:homoserine kinase